MRGANNLTSKVLRVPFDTLNLNGTWHWGCEPEQCKESIGLNDHADDGKAQQDDDDSTKEGCRALDFVPLEEKAQGSLHADHTSQAR